MGQSDPTRNPIGPNPFLTHLKWPILARNLNPTWPARFAMSSFDHFLFFVWLVGDSGLMMVGWWWWLMMALDTDA